MGVGAESRVRARIECLLAHLPTLQGILREQHGLVAGQVQPGETWGRLSVASRIGEACQRLELKLVHSGDNRAWLEEVRAVRMMAESVLRENPVLQAQGPLHVVRFEDNPDRYVLNEELRRELRKGFGLHRRPKNDDGPSVVIAFTPPEYEQRWHAHPVDEYTLVLDTSLTARYLDRGVLELETGDGGLFHFTPHTYHTLVNQGQRTGRTVTAKYPLGMSQWLPALDLTGMEPGSARVWSVSEKQVAEGARLHCFPVEDTYHHYSIEVVALGPGLEVEFATRVDEFLLVLDGCVEARSQGQSACASVNDLLVVEPTRCLSIRARGTGARFYRATAGSEGGAFKPVGSKCSKSRTSTDVSSNHD